MLYIVYKYSSYVHHLSWRKGTYSTRRPRTEQWEYERGHVKSSLLHLVKNGTGELVGGGVAAHVARTGLAVRLLAGKKQLTP
jgi:hypothetical protein